MRGPFTFHRSAYSLVLLATLLAAGPARVFGVDSEDIPYQNGKDFTSGTFQYDLGACGSGTAIYPILGRINVSDNNSPMPTDRIYFGYNTFQDSVVASSTLGAQSDRAVTSAAQQRFGIEKTFFDRWSSLELRMPYFSNTDSLVSAGTNTLSSNGGSVGNLTVISKILLWNPSTFALSAGLGMSLPTGDDARFDFPGGVATLKNQAVHLQPFLGFASKRSERGFVQGFLQLDTPLGANPIELQNTPMPLTNDRLTEQTVLYCDIATGYWLYRTDDSAFLTGLIPMFELHYTTSLQDAHTAQNSALCACPGTFEFCNPRQRFDSLYMTLGMASQFRGRTQIRVAGAIPISSGDNNFFKSELLLSVIRSF